jgi:hypothetical protein
LRRDLRANPCSAPLFPKGAGQAAGDGWPAGRKQDSIGRFFFQHCTPRGSNSDYGFFRAFQELATQSAKREIR